MFQFSVNAEALLGVFAAILALVFDYAPSLASKFDGLTLEYKRLITLVASALLGLGVFMGQCTGYFDTNLACDAKSALQLGYDIVFSVAVMYGFHMATKPSESLKDRMFNA